MQRTDDVIPHAFLVDVVRGSATITVRFVGELDAAAATSAHHVAQRALATSDAPTLVLDLTDVVFCDSSGLQSLLIIRREAAAAGRHVAFTAARRPVRRVFEL